MVEPPCDSLSISSIGIGIDDSLIVKWDQDGSLQGHRSPGNTSSSGGLITVNKLDGAIDRISTEVSPNVFTGIQALPHHEFLLYGAPFQPGGLDAECNAVVIDASGNVRRTGFLGPGINDVRTTSAGRIIVAYSDEGLLGGEGEWGVVGGAGISEFDLDFRQVWAYPNDGSVESIIDCYALNVVGEAVWAYGYDAFDISRIDRGVVSTWSNRLKEGAGDILVAGAAIALTGGYDESPDKLSIYSLEDGFIQQIGERRLIFEGLKPASRVNRPDQVAWNFSFANGSMLHRVTLDGRWYRIDISELIALLPPLSVVAVHG
ncbi:hypothetical protein [Glycomyces sp. NRRL B-16210]|uniref:hypothetical protein n=1 Tax=Glycomyces sp. NRRL B-16210 TaxID=1463821 RepID=UPI0010606B63|nr:hypothetical protein [Glycomyces sp. NRRL B-16210]